MKLTPARKKQLKAALREDIGKGDVTSQLLVPAKAKGKAVVIAKEAGVFYGRELVSGLFKLAAPETRIVFFIKNGQKFSRGKKLFEMRGKIQAILKTERVLLNLLGHLCGIATKTQAFVQKTKNTGVRILDTRKTTPLWRELEKAAVKAGGGQNHRMGLYDAVFVKENHRKFGNLRKLKKIAGKFEIEVRNLREAVEALALRPRVILFDNFNPAKLKQAVALVRKASPKTILEASGGVTLANVAAFARTGVDQISVGSLTHSVRAIDLSMLVE